MKQAISSKAQSQKNNPDNLCNIRRELIKRQKGRCPITGRDLTRMTSSNVVVDHDHQTGVIRAALPRAINGLEGKLTEACIRWGQCGSRMDVIRMLRAMADYLDYHTTPRTEWIHPSHKTAAEKRAIANRQARKRYAAKKKG